MTDRPPRLQGWCIVRADRSAVVDVAPGSSEADAWRIALGHPTRGEVRAAVSCGAFAFACQVIERARLATLAGAWWRAKQAGAPLPPELEAAITALLASPVSDGAGRAAPPPGMTTPGDVAGDKAPAPCP